MAAGPLSGDGESSVWGSVVRRHHLLLHHPTEAALLRDQHLNPMCPNLLPRHFHISSSLRVQPKGIDFYVTNVKILNLYLSSCECILRC